MMNNSCPTCNAPCTPDAVFCDSCGSRLDFSPPPVTPSPAQPSQAWGMAPAASGSPVCPGCGSMAMPGELFCAGCGHALTASAPQPASMPQPDPWLHAGGGGAPLPLPPAAANSCVDCGSQMTPDMRFCDNCGAPAKAVSAPSPSPSAMPPAFVNPGGGTPTIRDGMQPSGNAQYQPPFVAAAFVPRLVVQASGITIRIPELPQTIVGREDALSHHFPQIDLGPHGGEEGGVSRNHALLFREGNRCLLQDSQSTNGTWVNRVRVQPGLRQPLQDGDELRFGRVTLIYHSR